MRWEIQEWQLRIVSGLLAAGSVYWGVLLVPIFDTEHWPIVALVSSPWCLVALGYMVRTFTKPPTQPALLLWRSSLIVHTLWLIFGVFAAESIPTLWWIFAMAASLWAFEVEEGWKNPSHRLPPGQPCPMCGHPVGDHETECTCCGEGWAPDEQTMWECNDHHAIRLQCHSCRNVSAFPESAGGRIEKCPQCGKYVDVPVMSSASHSFGLKID